MFNKDCLTHEQLRGLFKSNFELASYAIRLGSYLIKAGHEVVLDPLLDEVRKNPSDTYLDTLKQIDAEDHEEHQG